MNLQIPAWAYVEEQNQILSAGGRHKPSNCLARHKVAIVIPYRDREVHLKIFLQNIHPFLRSQQLDYAIFVVELVSWILDYGIFVVELVSWILDYVIIVVELVS